MKILISGAQGTGKSTLNRNLLKRFPEFISLDNLSSKFLKSKEDLKDPELLRKFQAEVSTYCFYKYLWTDNYISSRSLADAYAYNKFSYLNTNDNRYKIFMDLSLDLARDFDNPECVNIFIPKMFKPKSELLRSGNEEFQDTIDSFIKEFNTLSGLEIYTVKSNDINERVEEVSKYIKTRL